MPIEDYEKHVVSLEEAVDRVLAMGEGAEANRKAIETHSRLEEVLADITRRRKHTSKASELATLEELRRRCIAALRNMLQNFFGIPQSTPGTVAVDATLTEIEETLVALEPEVHNLVGAPEDQDHFRQAIEIHSKLENAAKTLKRVREIPSLSAEEKDKAEVVRIRLVAVTKILLEDIFKVEPDAVEEMMTPPVPASEPEPEPQPEPPAHPSVGDGLVAIAKSIDHLAEAIHFTALPRWQRDRRTF